MKRFIFYLFMAAAFLFSAGAVFACDSCGCSLARINSEGKLTQTEKPMFFGDLNLTGIFKLLKKENNFIGPLAGIKFPTGVTDNKTPQGDKFEPEMQPGSGSFAPSLGTAFAYRVWRIVVHGNATYTIRTRGAQDFRFGNLFSTYVFVNYLLNSTSKYFQCTVGIDATLQNEQKQRSRTGRVADSGGTTLLFGPELSIRGHDYVSIFGNFLFPAIQNLGGVHQHLQFVWNAGVKISF